MWIRGLFFACKSTSLFKWYLIINALRFLPWRRPAGPGRQERLHEPPSANVVRVSLLTTEFRRHASALILKTERLFYGRN